MFSKRMESVWRSWTVIVELVFWLRILRKNE